MKRTIRMTMLVAVGLCAPSWAGAQFQEGQEFSVERFELPSDRGGLIGVEWAGVPKHLEWGLGLWLGGADDPLVLNMTDPGGDRDRVGALVGTRVGGSLTASLGLFDWINLTVDLPLVLYQDRPDSLAGVQGNLQGLNRFGMGAPRLIPKLRLLRQADHGVSLALLPTVSFPQANQGHYFGDRGWGFSPSLALSRAFKYLRVSMDAGVRIREDQTLLNLEISDELFARAGVGLTFADFGLPPIQWDLAMSMATALRDPLSQDYHDHVELLSGLRYDIGEHVVVFAGGGVGVERGFGTPDWRVFGGLRFTGALSRDEPPARLAPPQIVQVTPCCREPAPEAPVDPIAQLIAPGPEPAARALAPAMVQTSTQPPRLEEVVFFAYGRAEVRPQFAGLLAEAARTALAFPELGTIRIVGHTDHRGPDVFNDGLSKRRAEAVKRFLLAMGVPEARLEIRYHGEAQPMARNDMPEGRLLNRRVEVVAGPEAPAQPQAAITPR